MSKGTVVIDSWWWHCHEDVYAQVGIVIFRDDQGKHIHIGKGHSAFEKCVNEKMVIMNGANVSKEELDKIQECFKYVN